MSGFVLAPGSTGFVVDRSRPLDNRPLLSLIHETAREAGFSVEPAEPVFVVRSFDARPISLPFEPSLAVVIHRVVPVFAIVNSTTDDAAVGRHVVDWQAAALAPAAGIGWHRLTSDEACQQMSDRLASELTIPEVREIAYWKPSTVGEAIFNLWD